jgi:WxcM-like, C-terminal
MYLSISKEFIISMMYPVAQNEVDMLTRSYNYGLYLSSMVWRELDNFSSGSVCMVLASTCYEESDYYRNYDEFTDAVRSKDRGSSIS